MISLVLPAYNPGPAIERTLQAVRQFLAAQAALQEVWEVLFVLDGCTDGTGERIENLLTNQDQAIRIVSYPVNRGKGYAVRTGLGAARGGIRIFTDVDLAYPFEDVLRMAAAIRNGAAVAIGSRGHPESRVFVPAGLLGYAYRRALQGRLFGAVARSLLPISNSDTQAGLKGMIGEVADALIPHLTCDGFGFDCELLTACARSGLSVVEVPVSVRYDDAASTTGARSAVRMLGELWRIRRAWRGKSVPIALKPSSAPIQKPTAAAA